MDSTLRIRAMLQLHFEGVSAIYSFTTPHCIQYVIDANGVYDADGRKIAACNDGNWVANGAGYTHWHCQGPVSLSLHFAEDAEPSAGNMGRISVYGCVVQFDALHVATIREGAWYCNQTNRPLLRMVLSSPG